MRVQRPVKLFRNGRNQAVRIPREFEIPGQDAVMTKDGDRLIIERRPPAGPNAGLLAVLSALEPLAPDDAFPDISDQEPGPVSL